MYSLISLSFSFEPSTFISVLRKTRDGKKKEHIKNLFVKVRYNTIKHFKSLQSYSYLPQMQIGFYMKRKWQ